METRIEYVHLNKDAWEEDRKKEEVKKKEEVSE